MNNIKEFKEKFEQKILESSKIVIVPHSGIDFDAIASAIAISLIARKFNKPTCIIVNDPSYKINHGVQTIINEVINDISIINSNTYMRSRNYEESYQNKFNDLFVLVDFNSYDMLSLDKDFLMNNKTVIIDHHIENEKTIPSDIKYINQNSSSASEILSMLLCMFKVKKTKDIANYLLAGIYLDTDKLSKNITSSTMRLVSNLLKHGASMNYVTELFAEDFISDKKVLELVSKSSIITYCIAIATADDDIEYTKEELAKVADYLLRYKADASFAIGNIGDNKISISARSKDKVDVGLIMHELNGGGTKFSAATKLDNITVEEASKILKKIIEPPYYINE